MAVKQSTFPLLLSATLAVTVGACAIRPQADDPEAVAEFRQNNDPVEPFNRGAYGFN